MPRSALLLLAMIGTGAIAQTPAPAADSAASQARGVAQARAMAAARARFDAAMDISVPEAPADPGRARPSADAADTPLPPAASSPYGGYYRIRTPWER